MAEKSDVIRRLKRGQSMREISKETGVHRATIRSIRQAAISQGWLEDNNPLPDESAILDTLSPPKSESNLQVHPLDVHLPQIEEWLKEKTSFILIHEFLSQRGVTLSETTVRRYIQRRFPPFSCAGPCNSTPGIYCSLAPLLTNSRPDPGSRLRLLRDCLR